MSVMVTAQINGLPDPVHEDVENPAGPSFQAANRTPTRLSVTPTPPEQQILFAKFRSLGGPYWTAIGGGAMVAEAITFARENCPADSTWDLVSWEDLYSELNGQGSRRSGLSDIRTRSG
jgi:hypothetical protein